MQSLLQQTESYSVRKSGNLICFIAKELHAAVWLSQQTRRYNSAYYVYIWIVYEDEDELYQFDRIFPGDCQ